MASTGAAPGEASAVRTTPNQQGTVAGGRRASLLAGLRAWLVLPVFFDFVWQDSASPTVRLDDARLRGLA